MGRARTAPVVLALPFTHRWVVRNSPARRVPSHGVDLLGQRYAIDFVGVDERGRTAYRRDWRSWWSTEPPERFFAFGRPILAPTAGVVVAVHDGEPDHAARRSPLALVWYALGQASRLRQGVPALAGNYLTIALPDGDAYVALVHLRSGSIRVAVGDPVAVGQQVAECGNSGNSTQPHLHIQVMDSPDLAVAQGLPMAFRDFRERARRGRSFTDRGVGVPDEGAYVEPVPPRAN